MDIKQKVNHSMHAGCHERSVSLLHGEVVGMALSPQAPMLCSFFFSFLLQRSRRTQRRSEGSTGLLKMRS